MTLEFRWTERAIGSPDMTCVQIVSDTAATRLAMTLAGRADVRVRVLSDTGGESE